MSKMFQKRKKVSIQIVVHLKFQSRLKIRENTGQLYVFKTNLKSPFFRLCIFFYFNFFSIILSFTTQKVKIKIIKYKEKTVLHISSEDLTFQMIIIVDLKNDSTYSKDFILF
jgi:hypothetical protein